MSDLAWADVFALAVLAGIGFTVALLIGELAFPDPADAERIKAAVLVGSVTAAGLAALLVKRRNGIYRRLYEEETRDEDADGVPDVYQRRDPQIGSASAPDHSGGHWPEAAGGRVPAHVLSTAARHPTTRLTDPSRDRGTATAASRHRRGAARRHAGPGPRAGPPVRSGRRCP